MLEGKDTLVIRAFRAFQMGEQADFVRFRGMLGGLGAVDIGHMVEIDLWYQWINQNQPWYGVIL